MAIPVDYPIVRRLGSGGMGDVYLVREPRGLHRDLAIKVMTAQSAEDPGLVRMFEREGRVMVRLDNHENIVRVLDAGHAEGRPCLLMEFLDGCDLNRLLKSHPKPPPNVVLALLRDLMRALQHAHELPKTIVHRDVKPGNLLLTYTGLLKLMDFGLGRVTSEDSTHTVAGPKGTVPYMSPESFRGDPGIEADVFAAGVVGYQMIAGRRPFDDGKMGWEQVQNAILTRDPAPLSEVAPHVAPAIADVIHRMLSKTASLRPRAREVIATLDTEFVRRGITTPREVLESWAREVVPRVNPEPDESLGRRVLRVDYDPEAHAEGEVEEPEDLPEFEQREDPQGFPRWLKIAASAAAVLAVAVLAWLVVPRLTPEPQREPESKPKPVATYATFEVIPSNATVWLNGVHLRAEDLRRRVIEPRTHHLSAQAVAFRPYQDAVTVRAGADTVIRVELIADDPDPRPDDPTQEFDRADRMADPAARIQAYAHFVQQRPTHPLAPKARYKQALAEWERNEVGRARALFEEVIQRWPQSEEAESAGEMLRQIHEDSEGALSSSG